jgi:DNA-binding MarR family transcriptional regulator
MADIIESEAKTRHIGQTEAVALVELLFFAYRDFVGDADEILADLGFGRAHHRVLHFVGRDPGMTVAQLLDMLRITKQSLSRVLKDLLEEGYVFQKEGSEDRRQRLLHLTSKGETLWNKLITPQAGRFKTAVEQSATASGAHYEDLLFHLVNAENRTAVREWIDRVSVIGNKD